MRRVRYAVATSVDGFIAGPQGEADWITIDPDIDFAAIFQQFDTVLLGRHTYQTMANTGATLPGMKTIVFSRTLPQADHPNVTIVADNVETVVENLKASEGKDIWLFGGSSLFRSLTQHRLVDTVELSVVPILLGEGIPLLPSPTDRIELSLTSLKTYKTGVVALQYDILVP